MFTYACNAKPATMEEEDYVSYDPKDMRGVYGCVTYKTPLPKSDEDLRGLELVDGPYGLYSVSIVRRHWLMRESLATYYGMGYDVLRRADLEAIRREKDAVKIILEYLE